MPTVALCCCGRGTSRRNTVRRTPDQAGVLLGSAFCYTCGPEEALAHQILELVVQRGVGEFVLLVLVEHGAVFVYEAHHGDVPMGRLEHAEQKIEQPILVGYVVVYATIGQERHGSFLRSPTQAHASQGSRLASDNTAENLQSGASKLSFSLSLEQMDPFRTTTGVDIGSCRLDKDLPEKRYGLKSPKICESFFVDGPISRFCALHSPGLQ